MIVLDLYTPNFEHITSIPYESCSLSCRQNQVGKATVRDAIVDESVLTRDAIVVATYKERGYEWLIGNTVWFLRRHVSVTRSKTSRNTLWLHDANTLLDRRIVAYAAGSAEAAKSGQASSMIVEIVREQFTTATDPDRIVPILVPDAAAYGTTQSLEFSRDRLRLVLEEIVANELEAGNWIGYAVEATNVSATNITDLGLTFRLFAEKRGIDRSRELLISSRSGSVQDFTEDINYEGELTSVYTGGADTGEDRVIGYAERSEMVSMGPFARIEAFRNLPSIDLKSTLDDKAESELRASRARQLLSVPVVFTPTGLRWGIDLGYGDVVTLSGSRSTALGRVQAFDMTGDQTEGTKVEAIVEGYAE